MAQVSLYYRTQLQEKVTIAPNQINAQITDHIFNNLKANIEGKSNENGIVLKVNKLIKHDLGKIDRVNLTSKVDYLVTYECYLCSPIKDLEIVCELENNVKGYLIGKNGPIVVVVQLNNIDNQRFELKNSNVYHIPTEKELKIGDYLKVSIINISNNSGENKILALCKLINMATKDEIENYKVDKALITGNMTDSNDYI